MGLAAADIDGDGRLDLAVTDQGGNRVAVLLNIAEVSSGTVAAQLSCVPSSGTLPFTTQMSVRLENLYDGQTRRVAARLDATLASGASFPSWRAGYTNIAAGGSYVSTWNQNFPALGTLVGENRFTLLAVDVTPVPYNQPPYPASGDSASDSCTVTGVAP